jgi:hypothetical protein
MANTHAGGPAQPGRALADALRAAAEGASETHLMDLELRILLEGRRYCFEWIEGLPRGDSHANAAQFLRAWGEATSRVIQILKARRALAAQGNGDQGILAALVEELEQSPGLRRDGPNAEEPAPAAEAVRRG